MLRWYAECRATPEPHIKVIANTKQVQAVLSPHPHNIFYKCAFAIELQACNMPADPPRTLSSHKEAMTCIYRSHAEIHDFMHVCSRPVLPF